MSMKVDMLVALLAIHLTTAFSTESVQSKVGSSLSASEIERKPGGSVTPTDCDTELATCVEKTWRTCGFFKFLMGCLLDEQRCYNSLDLCKAAEIGSGHWEVESSSSASEIERKPGGSENPTECDSELTQCLKNTWGGCGYSMRLCVLSIQRCYHSRDLCEVESAHWEVVSSSSASEVERKPGGSENPTESIHWEVESSSSASEIEREPSGSENNTESAHWEVESSLSASEIERKHGGSENPTECDSELTQCLENTWEGCGYSMRLCVLIIQRCYGLRDVCGVESAHWEVESSSSASEIERKPGGSENHTESAHWQVESSSSPSEIEREPSGSENNTESAQSKVGSSLSASEIERKPGGSVTPTECDSELTQCLENTWKGCGQSMKLCALIVLRCYGLRDVCGVESTHWQVESSSSPSEIERKASGSENLTGST